MQVRDAGLKWPMNTEYGSNSYGKSHKFGVRKQSVINCTEANKIPREETGGARGRRFSEMSISQKLVFGLSFFAVSNSFREQVQAQQCNAVTGFLRNIQPHTAPPSSYPECLLSSAPQSLPDIGNDPVKHNRQPVCKMPTIMEQIGPAERMSSAILKRSDEVSMTLGMVKEERVTLPVKYMSFGRLENTAKELGKIVATLQQTISRDCSSGQLIFSKMVYQPETGLFELVCPAQYWSTLTPCFRGLLEEAEEQKQAMVSLLNFRRETGFYEEFQQQLLQLEQSYTEALRAVATQLNADFQNAKKTIKSAQNALGSSHRASQIQVKFPVDVSEQEGNQLSVWGTRKDTSSDISSGWQSSRFFNLLLHQIQNFEHLFETDFGKLHRQCLARESAKHKAHEKFCKEQEKIQAAREIREQVEKRRLEIEASKNSLGMKFLNVSGVVFSQLIFGVVAIPVITMFLPSKLNHFQRRRAKVDAEEILRNIIQQRQVFIKELDKNIKACEKADFDWAEAQKKQGIARWEGKYFFPQEWSEPNLRLYINPHQRAKDKRHKQQEGSLIDKAKGVLLPQRIIPDYPWEESIPWGHSCIKPIYRRGGLVRSTMEEKNILAYAYFDKSSLAEKKKFSAFTQDEIKKIEDIHESGRYASHERGATGYKCFKNNKTKVWEFKLSGEHRLYGLELQTTKEGRQAGVPPLVIFDQILKEKL